MWAFPETTEGLVAGEPCGLLDAMGSITLATRMIDAHGLPSQQR
jgi:hypothetical protein